LFKINHKIDTLNTSIKLFCELEIFLQDLKYSEENAKFSTYEPNNTNRGFSNLILTVVLVFKLMIIFIVYLLSTIPFVFFKTSNLVKPYNYVKVSSDSWYIDFKKAVSLNIQNYIFVYDAFNTNHVVFKKLTQTLA
jgi:hypothetical protein